MAFVLLSRRGRCRQCRARFTLPLGSRRRYAPVRLAETRDVRCAALICAHACTNCCAAAAAGSPCLSTMRRATRHVDMRNGQHRSSAPRRHPRSRTGAGRSLLRTQSCVRVTSSAPTARYACARLSLSVCRRRISRAATPMRACSRPRVRAPRTRSGGACVQAPTQRTATSPLARHEHRCTSRARAVTARMQTQRQRQLCLCSRPPALTSTPRMLMARRRCTLPSAPRR